MTEREALDVQPCPWFPLFLLPKSWPEKLACCIAWKAAEVRLLQLLVRNPLSNIQAKKNEQAWWGYAERKLDRF